MRNLLTALCLLPTLVLAQELHTFKNGEVADAEKINQNFNYVLENASGGCSATQQDNSVLIECADGTSGVIAGAGSAIILPNGEVGEAPDISVIPLGDFYWEDGNGALLGEYNGNLVNVSNGYQTIRINSADGQRINLYQNSSLQLLIPVAFSVRAFSYAEADCQGVPIALDDWASSNTIQHIDGQYWATSDTYLGGDTLIRSSRYPDRFNTASGEYESRPCINDDTPSPGSGTIIVTYDLPAAWLNPAYPLTLTQSQ